MAMGLVQGAHGFPFLAPPIYQYIAGGDMNTIKLHPDDVTDVEVANIIQKV